MAGFRAEGMDATRVGFAKSFTGNYSAIGPIERRLRALLALCGKQRGKNDYKGLGLQEPQRASIPPFERPLPARSD